MVGEFFSNSSTNRNDKEKLVGERGSHGRQYTLIIINE